VPDLISEGGIGDLYSDEGGLLHMNKVYHLDIEVYSMRYGCLREKNARYANLFFSLEDAYQAGKEIMNKKIRELYEDSYYCNGKPNSRTLEDFIEADRLFDWWAITEIDLDRLKAMEDAGCERMRKYHKESPPIHIEYAYNHKGELLHRYYIWRMGNDLQAFNFSGTYYQNREGDELPEAGTKFQIGDFVRLKRPGKTIDGKFDTDVVFVVADLPNRNKDGLLIENTYRIETVSKEGKYQWDSDFHLPFSGIHENELVKYEGDVDVNSPLWFLRRVFLGELGDVSEMVKKLENGELALTPDVTWGELKCESI
jgi:hypothetical protein